MARFATAIVFAMLSLLVGLRAVAQVDRIPDEKNSLRGLPGIVVFVEMYNDASLLERSVALSQASLRDHIIAKLRIASLPVISESRHDGTAALIFRVHALRPNEKGFVWSVDLCIAQQVSLIRATDIELGAVTWFNNAFGASPLTSVREDILSVLDSFLDRLIAEYTEVNTSPSRRP